MGGLLDRDRRQHGHRESQRFAELTQREIEIVHITPRVAPESDQRVRLAAQATSKPASQLLLITPQR